MRALWPGTYSAGPLYSQVPSHSEASAPAPSLSPALPPSLSPTALTGAQQTGGLDRGCTGQELGRPSRIQDWRGGGAGRAGAPSHRPLASLTLPTAPGPTQSPLPQGLTADRRGHTSLQRRWRHWGSRGDEGPWEEGRVRPVRGGCRMHAEALPRGSHAACSTANDQRRPRCMMDSRPWWPEIELGSGRAGSQLFTEDPGLGVALTSASLPGQVLARLHLDCHGFCSHCPHPMPLKAGHWADARGWPSPALFRVDWLLQAGLWRLAQAARGRAAASSLAVRTHSTTPTLHCRTRPQAPGPACRTSAPGTPRPPRLPRLSLVGVRLDGSSRCAREGALLRALPSQGWCARGPGPSAAGSGSSHQTEMQDSLQLRATGLGSRTSGHDGRV